MNYVAFYRKYRPSKFKDVIGQEHVIKTLKNIIKNNNITNAYIFAGPKGIGKTTIAKIFAKAVNCANPQDGDCCDTCENCRSINDHTAIDVLELDAASNNGVDDIRNINNNTKYLPSQLKKKVYIIDEAHMLTTAAWNALLKTIEEAPNYVIFIFATTEMHKIPATIISRCMYFVFNKFSDAQLQETILHVAKSENIHIDENALHKLTSLASGHARDVLSMLEQLALLTENNITSKDINDVFGLVEVQNKINFINQITSGDVNGSLETLNSYYQQGINLEILCSDLFTIILDKIIYLQTNNTSILKILNEDTASQINLPLSTLFQIINIFEKKSATIKNSSDAKFYFECIILAIISEISQNSTVPPAKGEKQIVFDTTKATTKNKIADAPTKQPEEPIKNNSNKLPDLKEIFSTKEFKQGNESTKSNASELNIENVFYAAVGSFNKQNLLDAQNYFEKIKNDKDQILQYVSNAVKPVIAGDDAIVLQYDDVVDAELLNHNLENAHFHAKIAKLLGKHMYFIGLTNKQLKKMSEDYLNNKKQVNLPKFANAKTILDLFDDTIAN